MLHATYERYKKTASPFLNCKEDLTEQIVYTQKLAEHMERASFLSTQPCFGILLTPELLDRYLPQELPMRSKLISTLITEVTSFPLKECQSLTYYFSFDGLKHFFQTGRIAEFPSELYSPLTLEDRILLIEKLLKLFEAENIICRMFRDHLGTPGSELFLFLSQESGYLKFFRGHDHQMIYLDIDEMGLLFTFQDFLDTLDEKLFYTQEEAVSLIRGMIAAAEESA